VTGRLAIAAPALLALVTVALSQDGVLYASRSPSLTARTAFQAVQHGESVGFIDSAIRGSSMFGGGVFLCGSCSLRRTRKFAVLAEILKAIRENEPRAV